MFIGFGATFQPLTVESLSPHQQFVIALRSPAGVCETEFVNPDGQSPLQTKG